MIQKSYRMMSFVPRWGITPRMHQSNIAEHSFYTALYVSQLCRLLKVVPSHALDAVNYALRHDALEIWTSDIPGPAKRDLISPDTLALYQSDFGKAMGDEYVEAMRDQKVHGHLGIRYRISDLVKVADVLDQCFYLYSELLMGNTFVDRIYTRALGRLTRKIDDLRSCATDEEQGNWLARVLDLLGRTVTDELKKMAAEGAWLPVAGEDKADGSVGRG